MEMQKMENSRVQWSCGGWNGDVENGELLSIVQL